MTTTTTSHADLVVLELPGAVVLLSADEPWDLSERAGVLGGGPSRARASGDTPLLRLRHVAGWTAQPLGGSVLTVDGAVVQRGPVGLPTLDTGAALLLQVRDTSLSMVVRRPTPAERSLPVGQPRQVAVAAAVEPPTLVAPPTPVVPQAAAAATAPLPPAAVGVPAPTTPLSPSPPARSSPPPVPPGPPPAVIAPQQRQPPSTPAPGARRVDLPAGTRISVGRAGGGADVPLPDPDLAALHTTLQRLPDGRVRVRDHGSSTGTYVDGRQVLVAVLPVGGTAVLGHHELLVLSGHQVEVRPLELTVGLVCADLDARWPGGETPALSSASLVVGRGEVLAIVGPSGAGKSTLFRVLLGELALDGGTASLGSVPLGVPGAHVHHAVNLVPQVDAVHTALSVRSYLGTVARLRLPGDVTRRQRAARVEHVAAELELEHVLDSRVGDLSGGQRKRVSLAAEVLSKPQLLLLDEPTSGLDEGLDRRVLGLLRELAGEGVTVVVVTHSTAHLDLVDRVLVMAPGGKAVYCGVPGGLPGGLGTSTFADVMDRLRQPEQADLLAGTYRGGPVAALARATATGPTAQATRGTTGAGGLRMLRHLPALLARQRRLLLAGGGRAALGLLGVPVFGALLAGAAFPEGLSSDPVATLPKALAVLVTVCVLGGTALTYANVVAERHLLAREARWGVGAASVVLSKIAVFLVVAVLQGALVAAVFLGVTGATDRGAVQALLQATVLSTVASACLGLLLSCLVNRSDAAVKLATAAGILQVALCGVLVPLDGPEAGKDAGVQVLDVASRALPARWGVSVAGAGAGLGVPRAVEEPADEDAVDEPAVDEPLVDEAAVDEPPADEAAVDEPPVAEAAVDEPSVAEDVDTELWLEDQAEGRGTAWLGGLSLAFVVLSVLALRRRLTDPAYARD